MIRLTVESVPDGDEARAKVIGRAEIETLGVSSESPGRNGVTLYDYAAVVRSGATASRTRVLALGDHCPPWRLVFRVLQGVEWKTVMKPRFKKQRTAQAAVATKGS